MREILQSEADLEADLAQLLSQLEELRASALTNRCSLPGSRA